MAARTVDKQHRLMYRTLKRERIRYKKRSIEIYPRMRHLLVYIHNFQDGNVENIRMKPPSHRASRDELLEAVVFHIILTLHSIENKVPIEDYQRNLLEGIEARLAKHESGEESAEVEQLLQEFTKNKLAYSKSDDSIVQLQQLLRAFSSLAQDRYSFLDLLCWLRSVSAASLVDSCQALANLVNIPAFVTSDILLRTPMSPEDLHLQVDIWSQFMGDITAAYHQRFSHIKCIMDNILFYSIIYDSSLLPEVLTHTLSHLTAKNKAYRFPFVNSEYLNRLMWTLAYDFTRSSNPSQAVAPVVSAQEIIVKCMSSLGQVTLNLEGNMGMVLAVSFMSPSKAQRFFSIAEQNFVGQTSLSSRELSCYNFTKTFLCDTPEALLDTFNSCAVSSFHSASLWFAFVTRLRQFDLLTVARSKKILDELVKHSDRLLITKDIVLVLTSPLQTLDSMHDFMRTLSSGPAGSSLLAAHVSLLTPKYLSVLYGSPDAEVVPDPVWNRGLKTKAVDLARHIYSGSRKTSKIVGIMLVGEAAMQPQNIYKLYSAELTDKNLFPDEYCLQALITAACSRSDSIVTWGSLFAPQVAIKEFKCSTVTTAGRSSRYCRPSDKLWQSYIAMLVQFDYVSELSTILQWWVQIEFHPSPETLLVLLRALPVDFATRCIGHFDKLRKESVEPKGPALWAWPGVEEIR